MAGATPDPLAVLAAIDRRFRRFVTDHSLGFLRYSLVVVFVWFGLLTATGTSETAGLVAAGVGFVPTDVFVPLLGGWEIAIGVALLWRRTVRLALVLSVAYVGVTMVPIAVLPNETFAHLPYGPSFEGAYFIKDWVLLGAVMAVGGLVESPGS